MEIQTLNVAGFAPAIQAMRSPMSSWNKSDSVWELTKEGNTIIETFNIGENDKELSIKLQKAGPEHCKHLRMIVVWANITTALTHWKQLDTYRFGVEKVSTSTMHKLMAKKLTADDFESCNDGCYSNRLLETIDYINELIDSYNKETDPEAKRKIWEYTIQILPQSYLQQRTVMMSYAALRNIIRQRQGHKLKEWQEFIDWCHTLPESWMLFE